VSNGSSLNAETTKNTIPINLKSSANGGTSLNLKSKSPISFLNDNGPQINNASSSPSTVTLLSAAPVSSQLNSNITSQKLTLTSVRGLANVNTNASNNSTQSQQQTNSGAPPQSHPPNLTSFIKPSPGTSPQVLLTNFGSLNNSDNMKAQLQQQQHYVNNIVNLANSNLIATPSTFHTIAQLYSNNSNTNQFHVRQSTTTTHPQHSNASITSGTVNVATSASSPSTQLFQAFQPIRLISNSNVNLSTINNNNNNNPTTVTLTNAKLPSTLLTNNNNLSNSNNNNATNSSIMQTVSSPSSSPLKPNIIRKAR
jgi:hypothetical protein